MLNENSRMTIALTVFALIHLFNSTELWGTNKILSLLNVFMMLIVIAGLYVHLEETQVKESHNENTE